MVEKVPLVINNTCITIDIPQYVYTQKNKFSLVELDDRACKINNLISMCDDMFPQNRTLSACLMKSNCTLRESVCRPKQFIYHYTGVLFSGKGSLNFIKKNPSHHENKIKEKEFSKFGIAWVSWEEAEYVQYDGLRLSGPAHATNLVTVTYPGDHSAEWWELLTNASSEFKKYETHDILVDLHDLKHVILTLPNSMCIQRM